jgi:hypothetical protein
MMWWALATDVKRQVGVHLGEDEARHESQELDADGDREPVGSRGSDACGLAALLSSSRQRLVEDIPIVGSVDRLQYDRAIRRAVYRLEMRDRAKIARVGYDRRHCA